jgi:MFS family permease
MDTGLLLAPQGFGAMITMPIAGRLSDKTGVGRIVPVGLTLVGLSFLALTQLEADTSYVWFGVVLFVMGLGMGATMMPVFSGAMQTLRQFQVARASTTLNINQQVGASIGTAVMSVLLAHELRSRLGSGGGIGSTAAIPPDLRAQILPKMADAFGATYWYALGAIVIAFVIATALLPKHKPAPVEEPPSADEAEAPPPVLMH